VGNTPVVQMRRRRTALAGIGASITKIFCKLQLDNGSTVAVGAFKPRNGAGTWAKTLRVDVSRLRGAELVSADGSVLASATFA
jgi:hypothetical protein